MEPQKSLYTYVPFKTEYSPILKILVWIIYGEVMVVKVH